MQREFKYLEMINQNGIDDEITWLNLENTW
jgi:hypothetical protein